MGSIIGVPKDDFFTPVAKEVGSVQTVTALEYLPRAEQGAPGSVKDFKIYLY